MIMQSVRTLAISALVFGGLALTPQTVQAVTTLPAINALLGGANPQGTLNLSTDDEFQFDALLGGSGSITFNTYVDPFIPNGIGSANILFSLLGGSNIGTATVTWGSNAPVDLTGGGDKFFDTLFTLAGLPGVQTLTFAWTGAVNRPQLSARMAAVSEVPVPGALLLFASGLGGLFALMRRRKKLSPA